MKTLLVNLQLNTRGSFYCVKFMRRSVSVLWRKKHCSCNYTESKRLLFIWYKTALFSSPWQSNLAELSVAAVIGPLIKPV